MGEIPPDWTPHYETLRDKLARYYETTGKYTKQGAQLAASSVARKLVREAVALGIDPRELDPEEVDSQAPFSSWSALLDRVRKRDYETHEDLARALLERELQSLDAQIEMLERAAFASEAAQAILTRRRLERHFLAKEILEELRKTGSVEAVERKMPELRARATAKMRKVVKELGKGRRKAGEKLKKRGLSEW